MALSNQGKVLSFKELRETLESLARQVQKLELKRSVWAAFGGDNEGKSMKKGHSEN